MIVFAIMELLSDEIFFVVTSALLTREKMACQICDRAELDEPDLINGR
jgi:hypothetical protein